jgi:type 1 fimbriae regulatory protein FimB
MSKPQIKNFLTEAEIERFLRAAKQTRNGARDYCMCLMAYRHGFRVSELLDVRLGEIDLESSRIYARRIKGSFSTNQPMEGDELRAVRRWLRERSAQDGAESPWLFISEQKSRFTRQAFNYLCGVIGEAAGLSFKVTPHMLRHSCGFALANKGTTTRDIQDFLGHKSIQHTVRYTAANAKRFEGIWRK